VAPADNSSVQNYLSRPGGQRAMLWHSLEVRGCWEPLRGNELGVRVERLHDVTECHTGPYLERHCSLLRVKNSP
jgi:hypothetical protein